MAVILAFGFPQDQSADHAESFPIVHPTRTIVAKTSTPARGFSRYPEHAHPRQLANPPHCMLDKHRAKLRQAGAVERRGCPSHFFGLSYVRSVTSWG
jgi:hypothetical protein